MAYKSGGRTLIGTGGAPAQPVQREASKRSAGSTRDADGDNEATTLFQREPAARWVSQLSNMVPRESLQEWQGAELPFVREAPANQQSLRRSRSAVPPVPQPLPPPLPPSAAVRGPQVARRSFPPPTAASEPPRGLRRVAAARVLEVDEIDYALEGRLQRSLRPARSPWRAHLGLALSLGAALLGLAVWRMPPSQWSRWASNPFEGEVSPAPLASHVYRAPTAEQLAFAAAPVAVPAAPLPEPQAPLAAAELPPAAQQVAQEEAPSAEPEAPLAAAVAEILVPRDSGRRSAHSSLKRHPQRLRGRHQLRPSRPMTPLSEAEASDAQPARGADYALGTVQINSRPWARVFVDGVFVGHTPQRGLMLPPGSHRVRLINDQLGMSKNLDVQVAAGRTTKYVELLDEN